MGNCDLYLVQVWCRNSGTLVPMSLYLRLALDQRRVVNRFAPHLNQRKANRAGGRIA